jgi:hypothetical protein
LTAERRSKEGGLKMRAFEKGRGRMSLVTLTHLASVGCLAAGLALAPALQAASIEFEISTEVSGSGGTLSGPIVVTFDDAAGPADVRLTIDLSNWDSGLSEYFSGLYINYSGAEATDAWETGFVAAYNQGASSNDGNEFDEVLEEFDGFKADGRGFFDVLISFDEAGGSRLEAGETAVFDITAAGADIFSFNIGSVNGGNNEIIIARARGLGENGEDSGWFTGPGCVSGDPECDDDVPPVPEPSTMLLMGGSLLALGYFRKRRNS